MQINAMNNEHATMSVTNHRIGPNTHTGPTSRFDYPVCPDKYKITGPGASHTRSAQLVVCLLGFSRL